MRLRDSDLVLGLIGTLLVVALWEAAVRSRVVDADLFPSPILAIGRAAQRLSADDVVNNTLWSLSRVFGGFLIGAATGIAIGVLVGWSRTFGLILRPVVELLRPIPPLAWIPLAIIWFGLGEPSKWFIIFLGAFFPVVTATWHGVSTVDPVLIRAARTFGLKGWRLLLRVVVPAALPDIATGLRIGWGLAFGILVAAELVAANRGLGFMIMNERNTTGSASVIMVGILLIGALNLLTDALLAMGLRRWVRHAS
jgi:ABC-type nitrate/sulfonate/bicarbonate transport system permease component